MDQFIYRSKMPASAAEVWAWHARAGALERLTPPWDDVRVVARTGGLEDGARVTLSVPVGPLRLHWVSRHRDCLPGRHFVDELIRGPFARWIHTHVTTPDGAGLSWLEDRIDTPRLAAPRDSWSDGSSPNGGSRRCSGTATTCCAATWRRMDDTRIVLGSRSR